MITVIIIPQISDLSIGILKKFKKIFEGRIEADGCLFEWVGI